MGFFVSERARRDGNVTVTQLLSALMMFVAFSIIGGFLIAGIALPAATVASNAAEGTAELFEELPQELRSERLPQQSNIYDRTGQHLLATFYFQNRVVVPLEEISPWMQKAMVSIEDRRFWQHNGVDGEGIARAAYMNFTRDDTEGASTITQQLIKNTLVQNAEATGDREAIADAVEVSMARKFREMRLALAYEENVNRIHGNVCSGVPEVDCGKEQILEQYLNIAQFGPNTYGAEAAARYYFNKPAAELTAIEAATIAGITQNPSRWDPTRFPENTEIRRNQVLRSMHSEGHLTSAELEQYLAMPIEDTLSINRPKLSCSAAEEAPFFCDYVTKLIGNHEVFNTDDLELSGSKLLERGGLEITTTLDLDKQKAANEEIRDTLPQDDPSGFAMVLVALDTPTGEILAMAQNRDFDPAGDEVGTTSINYATDRDYGGSRGFSPGSLFKPLVLAEWLNSGRSLRQTVSGSMRQYAADDWTACGETISTGRPWRPGNVGGVGAAQQTVLSATSNSVNTAYVAMANQLDQCDIGDMAERIGYHRSDGRDYEPLPSSVLGSQNVSPLTMASSFQTFANRGMHCEPIALLRVVDSEGVEYDLPQADCARAIPAELSDGVTHALVDVMRNGSGRPHQLDGRPSAGKTGTSQNNAHTWFAGYTPELTSVVWMGHPDRDVPAQFMSFNDTYYRYLYGSTLALPTWKKFMDRALDGVPASDLPTASSTMLNGIQVRVPNVVGMEERRAQLNINDAGFTYSRSDRVVFSNEYPPGTIVEQSPAANSTMTPGSTVSYVLATDQRPGWWTNWPSGWDPLEAPDDWWGGSWPPSEWSNNPPSGWNPYPEEEEEPEPEPEPEPAPEEESPPDDNGDDEGDDE